MNTATVAGCIYIYMYKFACFLSTYDTEYTPALIRCHHIGPPTMMVSSTVEVLSCLVSDSHLTSAWEAMQKWLWRNMQAPLRCSDGRRSS